MLNHISQAKSSYHSFKLLESTLLNRGPRTFILLRLPTLSIAWRGYSTMSIFPMPQQAGPKGSRARSRHLIGEASYLGAAVLARDLLYGQFFARRSTPYGRLTFFGQPCMAQRLSLSPDFLNFPPKYVIVFTSILSTRTRIPRAGIQNSFVTASSSGKLYGGRA